MPFTDDIKEVLGNRKSIFTIGGAIQLVLSVIGLLSVSALADSVYEFKGFLRVGVEFYLALSEPLRYILDKIIPINISRVLFDLIALASLTVGVLTRGLVDISRKQRENHISGVASLTTSNQSDYENYIDNSQDEHPVLITLNRPFRKFSLWLIAAVILFFVRKRSIDRMVAQKSKLVNDMCSPQWSTSCRNISREKAIMNGNY